LPLIVYRGPIGAAGAADPAALFEVLFEQARGGDPECARRRQAADHRAKLPGRTTLLQTKAGTLD
jgi:hypothetical protein